MIQVLLAWFRFLHSLQNTLNLKGGEEGRKGKGKEGEGRRGDRWEE